MSSVVNLVKQYPVRVYGYTVTAAVLALLVFLGVISAGAVPVILAVVGVVLSVGGTELVHSVVTPVAKRTP
jgi:hypothetical protein